MVLSYKEMKRKTFHLVVGVAIALLIYYRVLDAVILTLMFLVALVISFISYYVRLPFFSQMLDEFERKKDLRKFPGKGSVLLLMSAALVTIIFPPSSSGIAAASVMILALGDSFGPLVGQFGKIKHPLNQLKVIEGTVAGIIAATLGAMLFVVWWKALIAAAIAMTFEAMEIEVNKRVIDDNIVVPLIAGVVLWLMRTL